MTTTQRVSGIAIIVVSAIMLALTLAGIVGAWVARTVVNTELRELTTAIDNQLERLDSRAANVEGRVNDVLQRTQALRDRSQAFANRPLEDTALNAITAQVAEELAPTVERVSDAIAAVTESVESINRLSRMTNRLTGADLPTFTLADDLPGLVEGAATARARVADLQARVRDRRTEVRQELAAEASRLTMLVDTALQPVVRLTGNIRSRIASGQERVLAVPDRVDRTLLLPTVIVTTLLLGWLGFGQVALGLFGWLLFQGRLPHPFAPASAAAAGTSPSPADAEATPPTPPDASPPAELAAPPSS